LAFVTADLHAMCIHAYKLLSHLTQLSGSYLNCVPSLELL